MYAGNKQKERKIMQPRQTEFGLGLFEGLEIVAVYKPNYLARPEEVGDELDDDQIKAFHDQKWHYADITIQARFEGIVLGEIERENFVYGHMPSPFSDEVLDYTEHNFWQPVRDELLEDNQHNHAIFEAKAFLNRASKLMEAN